jgi:phosphoribosylamine--glycine ligase
MRILFVSSELIGSAICHRLIKEGHEVKLYIERDGWKKCLDGIVPKTSDWKNELSWVGKEGVIVFDDIVFNGEQDKLRESGYRVVGGSQGADKLELNRAHFHKVLEEHGVRVLPSHDFNDSGEAIDFIKKNPGQWVVKQNTHFGALSHVGEKTDGSDAIAILESYRSHGMSAHLQKRVHGVEIGVAKYFNGNDWMGPVDINHEHKRMCNDDVGPLTPEMGTVLWYSHDDDLPLFKETLAKIKPYLQKVNFIGDFGMNFIINEQGIWPLEATARFGVPATEVQSELMITPWSEFLVNLADGKSEQPIYRDGYGVVTSIAVPPFPYTKDTIDNSVFSTDSVQIHFDDSMTEEEKEHIYFEEVSRETKNDKMSYVWSGINGWVMHVTGCGDTISKARDKVYPIIDKIILPNKFHRTDIGLRVENHDIPKLKEWGWL